MKAQKRLRFKGCWPIKAYNGGLCVSRGKGRHPERVIDSYELIFVRQGVLGIQEAGCAHSLQAGQAIILLPGLRHGGTADYPDDLSFYWIHFAVEKADKGKSRTNPRCMDVPRKTTVARPDRLTELFRLFLNDQEEGSLNPAVADPLMFLMLAEMARTIHSQAGLDVAAAELASQVDRLIKLHFHEDLQTSTLAAMLRRNPDYLGRAYRLAYGRTITEAIHHYRLKKARTMLLEGTHSVKEIATECGFSDAGYFQRIFHRAEGVSPRAFHRLYSLLHVNTE